MASSSMLCIVSIFCLMPVIPSEECIIIHEQHWIMYLQTLNESYLFVQWLRKFGYI